MIIVNTFEPEMISLIEQYMYLLHVAGSRSCTLSGLSVCVWVTYMVVY